MRTFAVPQPMPVDVPVMTTLRISPSWADVDGLTGSFASSMVPHDITCAVTRLGGR